MKRRDVGVALVFHIKDDMGRPLDLTGASKVTLVARLGNSVFERECAIADRSGGVVKYIVQEGDLADSGRLTMEIRIEYADGRRFTTSRVVDVVEGSLR